LLRAAALAPTFGDLQKAMVAAGAARRGLLQEAHGYSSRIVSIRPGDKAEAMLRLTLFQSVSTRPSHQRQHALCLVGSGDVAAVVLDEQVRRAKLDLGSHGLGPEVVIVLHNQPVKLPQVMLRQLL
jgi:hypothetical protein